MNFGELAHALNNLDGSHLVLLDNAVDLFHFQSAIDFFATQDSKRQIIIFPDRESIPFSREFIPEHTIYKRYEALNKIRAYDNVIVISTFRNALLKLPPINYIELMTKKISIGENIPFEKLCKMIMDLEYRLVDHTPNINEFKRLGNLLEINSPNGLFRIEWDDNIIDNIWIYDTKDEKYRSINFDITLFPCNEIILTQEQKDILCKKWSDADSKAKTYSDYEFLKNGITIENLFEISSEVFKKMSILTDFFQIKPTIWLNNDYNTKLVEYSSLLNQVKEKNTSTYKYPLPEVDNIISDILIKNNLSFYESKAFTTDTSITINNISKKGFCHYIITCSDFERSSRCLALLKEYNIDSDIITGWSLLPNKPLKVSIVIGNCHWQTLVNNMLILPDYLFLVPNPKIIETEEGISSISQLNRDDYVVHETHGISQYLGLKKIDLQEFMVLKFAKEATIYVSIDQFHLISPYKTEGLLELSEIGSKLWKKNKLKAKKITFDYAAEILKIQAMRENSKGTSYKIPDEYIHFCDSFQYEPTKDQLRCIHEIEKDMQSSSSMDRLVCGDVGFGKTEVAMRAAFISAYNQKQTLVLAPTTLLASQHANSFKERFKNWPIRIILLTASNSSQTLNDQIKKGDVDIVVATHAAIRRSQLFHNVGLLIIDEEHRFGVKDKETIKKKFPSVEMLLMSATPIPRSLNFALSALRDISLITTPPVNRVDIITKVYQQSDEVILQALQREFHRGGQVYLVHNDIASIHKIAEHWKNKYSMAKVGVLHGRMKQSEQDEIMYAFSNHHINLLITTTVIESGIDIHNANTIIITRADKFGLSQLHQLRGRVGRSQRQAYSYFLIPNYNYLTSQAKARLQAIEYLKSLGSGYQLSVQDLEIRGGGSILGKEQSGVIRGIGYDLYLNMLKQACNSLKMNLSETKSKVELISKINLTIPDSFIYDPNIRLEYYQKIAKAENSASIENIRENLLINYGALPKSVSNLLRIQEVIIILSKKDVIKLKLDEKYIKIVFSNSINENSSKCIANFYKKIKIKYEPNNTISFNVEKELSYLDQLNSLVEIIDGELKTVSC